MAFDLGSLALLFVREGWKGVKGGLRALLALLAIVPPFDCESRLVLAYKV